MATIKQKVLISIDPADFELVKAAAHADHARSVNAWICRCIVMVAKTMEVQPVSTGPTFMGKPIADDDDE